MPRLTKLLTYRFVRRGTCLLKNFPLTPFKVTPGSKKKIWWSCSINSEHEWQATVDARNRGSGCPICSGKKVHITNCLATVNKKLASEWHTILNVSVTPYDVTLGSKKKVWWKCNNGHEYQSIILSRSHGHGCPECAREIKRATAIKRWMIYRKKINESNGQINRSTVF